ncbi:MAG: PAS domain-containing protein [Myxococcales bacterium]
MVLDIRTVIVGLLGTAVSTLVMLSSLYFRAGKRFGGIGLWLANYALLFTGVVLLVLRGVVPDVVSMVVADLLILGGCVLGYEGLRRFVGFRPVHWRNVVLLGIFTVIQLWFAVGEPSLAARNVNFAWAMVALFTHCLWALWREHGEVPLSITFRTGLVYLLLALVSAARLVEAAVAGPVGDDYFQSGMFETVVLLAYQALFLLLAYSFSMMVMRRLVSDVEVQEEKYFKAFRSAPYAMCVTQIASGKVVEANDGFLALLGTTREAALAEPAAAKRLWARPEDRDEAMKELAERGRVSGREQQFRGKGGELILGRFAIEQVHLGGVAHALVTIEDVTKSRRDEAEVKEAHDRLRSILDAAPTPIFMVNAEECVVLSNAAAARLFHAEAQGRRCGYLVGCVHREEGPAGCGSSDSCSGCVLTRTVRAGLSGSSVRDLEVELEPAGRPARTAAPSCATSRRCGCRGSGAPSWPSTT